MKERNGEVRALEYETRRASGQAAMFPVQQWIEEITSTPRMATGANKPEKHKADFSDWLDDLPEKSVGSSRPVATKPKAGSAASPAPTSAPTAPTAGTQPASATSPAQPHTPIPIPYPAQLSHLPTFALRSDLFGVSRPERFDPAKTYARRECSAPEKYPVACTGPMLSQRDKAVWLAIIDIAKDSKADLLLPLDVSLGEIARRMNLASTGGGSLNWIKESIQRLIHCEVEATFETGAPATGRLLASSLIAGQRHRVVFDAPFLEAALTRDKQFKVDFVRRAGLSSNVAIWLHDYLSTHSKAEPLDIDYLRGFCGYGGDQSQFPGIVAKAMTSLVSALPSTLIASFKMAKGKRDSNLWKLEYVRGTEKVSYISPKKHAKRGGVVL